MVAVTAHLGPLDDAVRARLQLLDRERVVARIWAHDPTVWKPDPETPEIVDRLGWLDVAARMAPDLAEIEAFATSARSRTRRVLLCGMGGSSLAPEVLWRVFGARAGWPALVVLDTTHPAAVRSVHAAADADDTLYLISSKSGTTQETNSLLEYFLDRSGGAGERVAAITDRGTPLEALATTRCFQRTFHSPSDIGGRYAALSHVGLVPAALIGLDVRELVRRGRDMARSCGAALAAETNPGAWLGAVLGEAARAGRDKLTLVLSARLSSFGLWVEQLVAESTGKEGKGIVPVLEAPSGGPEVYGPDRLFVTISPAGDPDSNLDALVEAMVQAGHPVVRIVLEDWYDLGGEFFRWAFATAVACAVLGVNPFDQPNVAESKANTKAVLARGVGEVTGAAAADVRAMLDRLRSAGNARPYLGLLVYLPPSDDLDRRLARLQGRLRDRLGVAVTAGYGPRYLHSTGQLHKGGPPTGHFIMITPRIADDLAIPGAGFTFGQLLTAQAEGDFQALTARGRPVLRLTGLEPLEEALGS